ncbi:hypothetical protein HCU01_08590 [Halomonas cupida]|uniref:Uncharacterized protein n=1 Tax=Halomonas cupida TaxID=44933 RepID=A0ABQ0WBF7_9GAMM|nr:hypothetical protein HCU01_08590 [Halomonas cupida]
MTISLSRLDSGLRNNDERRDRPGVWQTAVPVLCSGTPHTVSLALSKLFPKFTRNRGHGKLALADTRTGQID